MRKCLDVLERTGLVRSLKKWPAGSNDSLGSMPKIHLRDCGLLHAMLGLDTIERLRAHRAMGHSWESFAAEAIINETRGLAEPAFFRDEEQNEIDLVLRFTNGEIRAIEFKVNPNKGPKNGFHRACARIGASRKMIVHAGERDFTRDETVPRLSLMSAVRSLHHCDLARSVASAYPAGSRRERGPQTVNIPTEGKG